MNVRIGTLSDLELSPSVVVAPSTAIHASVPPILHGIVAASTKSPGNLGPPLSHLGDHLLNQHTLLCRNRLMIQVRLQVLMEPFPTLFR